MRRSALATISLRNKTEEAEVGRLATIYINEQGQHAAAQAMHKAPATHVDITITAPPNKPYSSTTTQEVLRSARAWMCVGVCGWV